MLTNVMINYNVCQPLFNIYISNERLRKLVHCNWLKAGKCIIKSKFAVD